MKNRQAAVRVKDVARTLLALLCVAAPLHASERRVDAVVEAVRKVDSCVVNISTDREMVDPFFRNFAPFFGNAPTRRVRSSGSGAIIHESGYVLTNYHVVRDADRVVVMMLGGQEYATELVAGDPAVDLAVLKLQGDGPFCRAELARSEELYVGETVIAMGNPFGLTNSVSRGVLSAVGREIQPRGAGAIKDLLQTDAAINPGNSGGPLVNVDAEIIGVNTAMQAGAENIGFATSIKTVNRFLIDRVADPRTGPGYTGLRVRLDGPRVVVESVEDPSSAARAGVRPGDVLVRAGSENLTGLADYFAAFFDAPRGEPLPLTVRRGEQLVTVALEPSAFDAEKIILGKLGLVVKDLDGNTDTPFDQTRLSGVLVLRVEKNSPAEEAEIEAGDAVISADEQKLGNAGDLAAYVMNKEKGEHILVEALRLERRGRQAIMIRSAKREVRVR